jgi:hypothetical protein
MGAVGGGIWHFSKGMYNSPRGISSRFAGGISVRAADAAHAAARTRARASCDSCAGRRARGERTAAAGAPACVFSRAATNLGLTLVVCCACPRALPRLCCRARADDALRGAAPGRQLRRVGRPLLRL